MQRAYILAYDICEAKRLRAMHRCAKAFGTPLQYSVFSCNLTRADRVRLAARIGEIIDGTKDRVVLIDVGPVPDVESWIPALEVFGRQEVRGVRRTVIV